MESQQLIKNLTDLAQVDYDASRCYDQAIAAVEAPSVHDTLIRFRNDHDRHFMELAALVRQFGGTPPQREADLTGLLTKGMTSIASLASADAAIKAMEINEKLINSRYMEAVKWDAPAAILHLLESFYADERGHLEYFEHALATKLWEAELTRIV